MDFIASLGHSGRQDRPKHWSNVDPGQGLGMMGIAVTIAASGLVGYAMIGPLGALIAAMVVGYTILSD